MCIVIQLAFLHTFPLDCLIPITAAVPCEFYSCMWEFIMHNFYYFNVLFYFIVNIIYM